MHPYLIIANSFSVCFGFSLLIKKLLNNKYTKTITVFSIIFMLDLIFRFYLKPYEMFSFYIILVILAVFMYSENKDIIKSLSYSTSILCYFQIIVSVLSSVIYFTILNQYNYNNTSYNIIMQISIIVLSILMYKTNFLIKLNPKSKDGLIFMLIYNTCFIIFLNYCMSHLYSKLGMDIYYLVSLAFILLKILLIISNKKDYELKQKNIQFDYLKSKADVMENNYRELMTLKDHTRNILNEVVEHYDNTEVLLECVTEKVLPTCFEYLVEKAKVTNLEQIKESVIKELIRDFINKMTKKNRSIFVHLDIRQSAVIFENNHMELFEAIEMFLNDAYEELVTQTRGSARISFYDEFNENYPTITFTIVSETHSDIELKKEVIRKKQKILKQILRNNSNIIELYAVREGNLYSQGIVVKNIN